MSDNLYGQEKSNVQVKVFDQALNPQGNMEIRIANEDIITSNANGIAFIELPENKLPPTDIKVNHDKLEVESWNYSKGVLEIILRVKSYREVTIRLRNTLSQEPVVNTKAEIHLPDTSFSMVSDRNGLIQFILPINQALNTGMRFEFAEYSIERSEFETNTGTLYLQKVNIEQKPVQISQAVTPVKKETLEEITINDLDSITSITVLYSLMKRLNLKALDPETKRKLDEKFDELLKLDSTYNMVPRDPLALINDTSIVSEDIKLIVEKIRLEESLLIDSRDEFEDASAQIQQKLKDGGQNLNEVDRAQLVQDVLNLREMLRKNEELFYKNNSFYNEQVNALLSQLADIYELEDLLLESEKESSEMREKFLIFFMAFLVVSMITVLLIYLIRIFRTQKLELAKANEEISKMNANLEGMITEKTKTLKRINYELDTFLYRSSHNMRGPITTIKGLANIAAITLGDDGKLLFDKVATTTKGMERMLDKLNMMNQLNRPQDFKELNINQLVEGIIAQSAPVIERRNILFTSSIDENTTFNSYQIVIEIILTNLIENAMYFSQFTSTERPKIDLKINKDNDDNLHITLKDNGCGIKNDVVDRIWNMFFIGIEKSKGSGLGLFITKKAVQTVNGKITVDSISDKYSEFKVVLPLFLPTDDTTLTIEKSQQFSTVETEKDRLFAK